MSAVQLPEGYRWEDEKVSAPPNSSQLPVLPNGYRWEDQTTVFPERTESKTDETPAIPPPPAPSTLTAPEMRSDRTLPFHELQRMKAKYEAEEVAPEEGKGKLAKEKPFETFKQSELPVTAMHAMAEGLRKEFPDLDERVIGAIVTKTTGMLQTKQTKPIWGRDLIGQFPKDAEGNPTEKDRAYIPDQDKWGNTIRIHALAEDPTHLQPQPDANSPTGWSVFFRSKQNPNVIVGSTWAAPPGAYAPTVTESVRMVPQADQTIQAVPVTSVTSRIVPGVGNAPPSAGAGAGVVVGNTGGVTPAPKSVELPPTKPPVTTPVRPPVIPHAGVTGPGVTVGQRGLTAEQRSTEEQKQGALINTMDISARVFRNLPLLDKMLNAGKIKFVADPTAGTLQSIISRGVTLTAEEAQMAADARSLSEHINTLRAPLGATGFRGPEAFTALQAQAVNLLSQPEVSRGVLNNTMRALLSQKMAHDKALARPSKPTLDDATANIYFLLNGKDPRAATEAAERDGYIVPSKR